MPANMTYAEAACVPFGARDSLHFLRLGKVGEGQKILINGAGGSIGSFGVQLAKHFGAEVTAIDSTAKLEMLKSVGADHVIDYTQEDFLKNEEVYDVIFDVVGTLSLSRCKKALREGGTYLLANPMRGQLVTGPWTRMTSGYKVVMQTSNPSVTDLEYLRGLIEEEKLKAVIDRTYPLDQIVEAHRYVDTGGKLGNLVITLGNNRSV